MSLTFLTEKDIRGFLALALVIVFLALSIQILWFVGIGVIKIQEAMLVISYVGTMVGVPIGYYFGSKAGESNGA